MLNISKISKMLLISGLVLAFSCVTFDVNIAYAADEKQSCAKAKKALKEAQSKTIDGDATYSQAKKAYATAKEQAFSALNYKMTGAKHLCNGVPVEHCAEYQTAVVNYEKAAKEETTKKSELDAAKKAAEEAIKNGIISAQEDVTKSCAKGGDVTDASDAEAEAQTAAEEGNIKDTRKTKKQNEEADASRQAKQETKEKLESAVRGQEAAYEEWNNSEIAKDKAKEDYDNKKKAAEEAQKAMKNACAKGTDSDACKAAQQSYASASNELGVAAQDYQDANDRYNTAVQNKNEAEKAVDNASKDAQNASSVDRNRAIQNVQNAQNNVDTYCTPGKKYNKNKCEKAKNELANAKSDETYKQLEQDSANRKTEKAAEAQAKKDAENEAIAGDASKAADAYISDDDMKALENNKNALDGKVTDAEAKLSELETARDAACARNKKSKDCREAQAALETQQGTVNSLKKQQAEADKQLTDAQATNGAVEQQLQACEADPSKAGCAELLSKRKGDDAKASSRALDDAKGNLDAAIAEKNAADKAYDDAMNAEALICGNDPESQACQDAKAATAAALERKNKASDAYKTATKEKLAAEANQENADVSAKESKLTDLKNKAKEACEKAEKSGFSEDGSIDFMAKAECDDLTMKVNAAERELLESKIAAACSDFDYDQESDVEGELSSDASQACKDAHQALANYDEQKAQELKDAAEKERQDEADRICKEAEEICKKSGEGTSACMMAQGECTVANEKVKDPNFSKVATWGVTEEVKETGFNYSSSAGGDVFEMVTRRAAMILIGIKPIVYVFAGFGLIAFAWGAIFNKISWKHFANIAIGLFLVANMGRLIEYFVTNSEDGNYYIGQWQSSTPAKDASNELSAAFQDSYYIYGIVLEDPVINDPAPVPVKTEKTTGGESDGSAQAEMKKRGYCQGDGSFLSGLKNCIGDVVGSIKKAANIVNTAVATVNHVKNRVEDVKTAAKNIGNAFEAMKGGSFSDVMAGMGTVLGNVSDIKSSITSAGGAIGQGATSIFNNTISMGDANTQQSGSTIRNLQEGFQALGNTGGVIENEIEKKKEKEEASRRQAEAAANVAKRKAEEAARKQSATPAATPASAPASTPAATPASAPASTPAATPAATPASAPAATPAATPASVPAATPASAPAATPASAPAATPAATPASVPAAAPAAAPKAHVAPAKAQLKPDLKANSIKRVERKRLGVGMR